MADNLSYLETNPFDVGSERGIFLLKVESLNRVKKEKHFLQSCEFANKLNNSGETISIPGFSFLLGAKIFFVLAILC